MAKQAQSDGTVKKSGLRPQTEKDVDAALKSAIENVCKFKETREQMDQIFEEESALYTEHLKGAQTAVTSLNELYDQHIKDNSVYTGAYHNEPEKKTDAKVALNFAKGCAEIKNVLAGNALKYASLSMKRMTLNASRYHPNAPVMKNREQEIVLAQLPKEWGIFQRLSFLIPLILGIICLAMHMNLRNQPGVPMIMPIALFRFFYEWGHIAFFVLCFVALITLIAGHFGKENKKKLLQSYIERSPAYAETEKADAELEKYYNEKAAKAKELSDTYFDIVNHQILESLINKVYLAPFPSEFANVSDLQAALDLLNSSRAENLKEVYEILERRHAEAARSNAEAQHRAKMESIGMETLRSQQKAEEYAKKQAEYAQKQAEYAREQAASAREQAESMNRLADESAKQTEYARQQAESAAATQTDVDYMRRNS